MTLQIGYLSELAGKGPCAANPIMRTSSPLLRGLSYFSKGVYGNTPEEVMQDKEGLQTMRTLGDNMAWLLKCIGAGREQGIIFPQYEAKIRTNFIR